MEITVDETGRHERRGRVEVEIKGKFPEIDLHLGALRSSEERLGWQVECHHRPQESSSGLGFRKQYEFRVLRFLFIGTIEGSLKSTNNLMIGLHLSSTFASNSK